MDALPGIVRPSPSASETEQMAGFWGTPADRGDRGKPADLLDVADRTCATEVRRPGICMAVVGGPWMTIFRTREGGFRPPS